MVYSDTEASQIPIGSNAETHVAGKGKQDRKITSEQVVKERQMQTGMGSYFFAYQIGLIHVNNYAKKRGEVGA